MLRLLIYLFAILKLLGVGKWYPPAHVRDVSTGEFLELVEVVKDVCSRLDVAERQVEATRKKVYRDESKVIPAEVPLVEKEPAEESIGALRAGDEVPPGMM